MKTFKKKKKTIKGIKGQIRDCLTEGVHPTPQDPPNDKGEWLRTDSHPPMRIMGRFFIWAILNMPGIREGGAGRRDKSETHGRINVPPPRQKSRA